MDILYTVEEKYLQAVEELTYGELPKALHLFHEIVNAESDYGRAYYQLGSIYHYHFKNFQSAGYYYKKCIELEAEFPDVYEHYLRLLITLNMPQLIERITQKALLTAGVCKAQIYESLGMFAEEELKFDEAAAYYKKASLSTSSLQDHGLFQDHLKRIETKQKANQNLVYAYQG